MVRSLGRAMSTMVVQERHLWLCLADMKEADKVRFLNAPVSQTDLFGGAVENFAQQFSAAQKQTEAIRYILSRRAAAASTRPPTAVPRSTRRRGRPPAAAPAPAQQPPAKQSPALRAVPVAPCLHESSGGSPCSPERTGRAHSQLPRRLAYTSSVAGPVMRTQGLGALAPQPVGPSGHLGKKQTLPSAEDIFSRYGVGLVQSDSAPHAGTRLVGVELLEYIQEQDGGTTETVSEAPGAYGGCGGGHAAGAAPYETASTLAPWPSPEVGMAERHAVGPSHSSLPPNLHPVVRPFIPSGRSAPGTGLQARCGLHRCLRQGLGGHVQWACSVGGLDGSPTALAHQLPRVAGSTPGLEPSQETLTRRACTGPYGQHCDRCVHQPTR